MLQTLHVTSIRAIKKMSVKLTLRLALGILVATLSVFVFGGGKAQAAACTPGSGLATLTKTGVSVPSAGTYNVWVRLMAGDSTGTNVGVETTASGGTPTCYTATSTDQTNWAWKNVGTFTATASNNTLKLVGTVANVKVDRVLLVSTAVTCTPNNVRNTTTNPITEPGDDCLNSKTPTPTPATPTPTKSPTPSPLGTVDKPSLVLGFDWLKGTYYVNVSWNFPTGTSENTKFDVIKGNQVAGTVTAPVRQYADYNIAAAGTYSYKVQAREGNQTTTSVVSTGTVNCFWIFCGLWQ